MPDVNNMFPSNWLKVGDLQGGTIDAVVSHVVQEEIKPGEMLWVMHFHPNPQFPRGPSGAQVGAVLKTQNADAIATIYGPLTETWAGKSIQLFIKQTNMGPGLGMRPVAAAFVETYNPPPSQSPVPTQGTYGAPERPAPPMGPGDQAAVHAAHRAAQAPLQPVTQPAQPVQPNNDPPGNVPFPPAASATPALPPGADPSDPINLG